MGIVLSDGRAVRTSNSQYQSVREAVTEVTRALEDLNWQNLSTDYRHSGNDETYEDRARLLKRIRVYRRRNPLAKQAANLLQHYVLGGGLSLRAENKKVVAKVIDEFWNDSGNQAVFTSHAGIKKFVDDLFTDGEYFLVMFPDSEAGTVTLGYLDPIFVEDPITDPENAAITQWYKVRKPNVKFDFSNGQYSPGSANDFTYYRDWKNADAEKPEGMKKLEVGLVYHITINKRGKRGESDLLAALDWLKGHGEFMNDRATLNRAAAQIAWKKKRKGGQTDVAAEVARLRSSLVENINNWETNPPAASGSTLVENEGSTTEWMKTDTGGANALADERILRMMAGSGMGGVPNHYFGDEASANLATATAMELPLLKAYEDWQTLVRDVVLAVLDFVLTTANLAGRVGDRDDSRRYADRVTTQQAVADMPDQQPLAEAFAPFEGTPPPIGGMKLQMVPKKASAENVAIGNDSSGKVSWYVDVDFPPIVQKDLLPLSTALTQLFGILPAENIESQKLIVEMYLTALGQNDIDQLMERLFPADMVAVLVPKQPPMVPPGVKPGGPKPVAQTQEAGPPVSLAEKRVTRLLSLAASMDHVAADDAVAVGS